MITLATFPFKLKMFTLKENLWIKQIWFQLLLYKNLQMYRNETYPIIVEWIKIDGTVSGAFSCWQIYRGYTSTRMHSRILFKVGNDFCSNIILHIEKRDTNNNFSVSASTCESNGFENVLNPLQILYLVAIRLTYTMFRVFRDFAWL